MSHPMLLTARDWQWWFGVSGAEADRLVSVQRSLLAAGLDPCPETVLGMSRTVLADRLAAARLRLLADLWDGVPAAGYAAEPSWPMPDEAHRPPYEDPVDGRRPRHCRKHRWPGRDDG